MAEDPVTKQATVRIADDAISRILEGEAVILGLATGTYFGLDAVGTRIWQLIEERGRVTEILTNLVDEYDVEPEECERDLLHLLGELKCRGLITLVGDQR